MQERRAAPTLTGDAGRTSVGRVLVAVAVAAAVVAADQATKSWAVHRLAQGPVHVVWKLDLILEFNSGGAFSIAQGWAPVIAGLAIVLVAVLAVAIRHARSQAATVALGLVVGGAVGNLADRLFRSHHGAVVDFVAVHFWPTFNVADACIVVGSLLLALTLWREGGKAASRP